MQFETETHRAMEVPNGKALNPKQLASNGTKNKRCTKTETFAAVTTR